MVLVIRFYLRQRAETSGDQFPDQQPQEIKMYDDETLVAWASMPLMVSAVQRHTPMGRDMRLSDDIRTLRMNTGTHRLQLFRPPVPEVDRIPLEEHWRPKEWERYGRANIRLNIFEGNPRPGSLTPSEASEDEEENLPEFAWISHERLNPPSEPYNNTDGFDVYIDGCRNLPDAVTVTKIAGRVLDRKYAKVGRDINTNVRLDSDIYNPIYNYKVEFREPNIPATATLLLKMYTVDKMYKQLIVAGYATLNIFVESGTERQPINNQGGVQVSLNEGCHQIRLYQYGPNGIDALTEACLRQAHVRHIPCATLLLRIIRAPIGPQGKPLESERIPQADWGRLGLWYPRPSYKDRLYFSMKCVPTKGESKLFHTLMRRPRVSIREAVHMIADERESRMLRSDKSVEAYVRDRLTKGMDMIPMDIDLTFIAQYSPKHGIKFSLDKAMNLPWSGFTMGHFCLNPPAAFYMGQPYASYDKLTFTDTLDLNSLNTAPVWFGGFMHFPNRSYHRFLTMVIHLQELSVTVGTDSYKYGLMEQAWTAVQVFSDGYAQTKRFQLPLFLGNPTQQMLRQLAREPCKLWIQRSLNNGTVRAAEGASVFVRLCDARKDEELSSDVPEKYAVEVDTDYVPSDKEAEYTSSVPGKPLITLVPQGKTPAEFADNLAVKFRSLVYKLYEDGSLNAR